MEQQAETLNELGAALDARRETIHTEMGGQDKIDRIHEKGRYTIRERIAKLVDPNSFNEVGTFAVSDRVEDRGNTPGDGKIGGFGTVAGRAMAVAGDDITVKRGSSSVIGSRKLHRIFETAWADGTPCVYFGETGGARIPDTLGSEGFVKVPPDIANVPHSIFFIHIFQSLTGSVIDSWSSARSDFGPQFCRPLEFDAAHRHR
ncbi:MAG: hypothetical protein DHS20C03_03360 [Minwuia thermotolerans]|nr:MAG: hypothetical protein DHS20C03_03360 [Minwuia thermotolerans]